MEVNISFMEAKKTNHMHYLLPLFHCPKLLTFLLQERNNSTVK